MLCLSFLLFQSQSLILLLVQLFLSLSLLFLVLQSQKQQADHPILFTEKSISVSLQPLLISWSIV